MSNALSVMCAASIIVLCRYVWLWLLRFWKWLRRGNLQKHSIESRLWDAFSHGKFCGWHLCEWELCEWELCEWELCEWELHERKCRDVPHSSNYPKSQLISFSALTSSNALTSFSTLISLSALISFSALTSLSAQFASFGSRFSNLNY